MATSSRQRPALLAVVAVSMLLSFSTAASASDGYIGEDPPGDGGGGGTGDLTRLLPTACVNGELWELRDDGSPIPGLPGQTGFRWLVRPNNVCPLTGTFTSAVVPRTITGTTTLLQVPAGWEVWRFYGDGDPREGVVRGYTVSWAATRAWNDSSNVITIVPHPDDSGTPTSRGPWRERTYTNVHGETVTVAEAGQISTNPPFRRFGDSCTSLRRPGAVTAHIGTGEQIVADIEAAYLRWEQERLRAEEEAAAAAAEQERAREQRQRTATPPPAPAATPDLGTLCGIPVGGGYLTETQLACLASSGTDSGGGGSDAGWDDDGWDDDGSDQPPVGDPTEWLGVEYERDLPPVPEHCGGNYHYDSRIGYICG